MSDSHSQVAPEICTGMIMRVVLYTNILSPHQLPLAREIVRLVGEDEFRYIYTQKMGGGRKSRGWNDAQDDKWIMDVSDKPDLARSWLEMSEVILSGIRDLDLFERREKRGLRTFYMSERWFKPPLGCFRLLHWRYFIMCRRFCRLLNTARRFTYLPIGIHAANDMIRVCGWLVGNRNSTGIESRSDAVHLPCEAIEGFPNMRLWGYFVESSSVTMSRPQTLGRVLRILWVGRLLKWKRIDTIIRAVASMNGVSLDIYGLGPEENRLRVLSKRLNACVQFHPPIPIDEVRGLMHSHDVYVLSSNAQEGWGAVVSEALEEGMCVLGTRQGGASSTLLPNSHIFDAGDHKELIGLLRKIADGQISASGIGCWTAAYAAKRFMEVSRDNVR